MDWAVVIYCRGDQTLAIRSPYDLVWRCYRCHKKVKVVW